MYKSASVSHNAPTNLYTNMYFSVFYTTSSICDVQHIPKVVLRAKVVIYILLRPQRTSCCVIFFFKSSANGESTNLETISFLHSIAAAQEVFQCDFLPRSDSYILKRKTIYHTGIKGASRYLWTLLTFINCEECSLENAALKPLQLECLDTLVSCVVCSEMSRKVASRGQKP